jgi:hypothetical protein
VSIELRDRKDHVNDAPRPQGGREELCSTDSDFSRFAGLRWTNPLEA